MGATKLLTAGGGGVTLDAASTATDKTITVPADNGTLIYANSSGNVGIGTSSPAAKLHVYAAGTTTNLTIQSDASNLGGIFFSDGSNNTGAVVYDQASDYMYFRTNGSERARIDSSGNLLVGTDTVNGVGGVTMRPNTSNGSGQLQFNRNSTSSTSTVAAFYNGGNNVGSITYTNTATAYVTSSDYRLKEDVQPMQGALETVAQLKPCTYTWKADGSATQGFIAHELQAVIPEAVVGEKDAVDADGNPVYQGIDTSFLVATLTAAIQELKAELDAVKAQLENK